MLSLIQKVRQGGSLRSESKGFSLAEMIIYIAILSLLLVVIVMLLSGIANSQRRLKSSRSVENSAIFGLDRIVREARDAQSIDTLTSQFGTHPGVLRLSGKDEFGQARMVEFYLNGNTLRLKENDIDRGPLTPEDARITNLVFYSMPTGNSWGIRVEMTIESGQGSALRFEEFSSTAILRGSY
jgi:type II secretory pathway pseudopilin PulG